jgi:DNA-binding NarL/FixJ family response regulator
LAATELRASGRTPPDRSRTGAPSVVLVARDPALLGGEEASLTAAGFTVVARVAVGPEATRAIEGHRGAIVVVDVDLRESDGVRTVRDVASRHEDVRVVAYTDAANGSRLDDGLAAGAAAVVKKSGAPADLVRAVAHVAWGRTIFFRDGARRRPGRQNHVGPGGLTTREVEVLALVAAGWTNATIAEGVSVTEQTVKFHLSNIFKKIGVTNRTAASRWYEAHVSLVVSVGRPGSTEADRAGAELARSTRPSTVHGSRGERSAQEENGWRAHVDEVLPPAKADPTLHVPPLSEREREVLMLVADGRSNADVGRVLWVTEETVKFHLSNIFRKLRVSNRTEAARWANLYRAPVRSREQVRPRLTARRVAAR